MTKRILVFSTIAFPLIIVGSAFAQAKLITANSAGKVKLGMTIAEVRKAVAPMKLSRSSDVEVIALIAVKQGKTEVMTIYAGEADRDAPIDNKARVHQIWVWSKRYKTAAGVHPGMLVSAAEKRYGKVKEIIISEIESREFATFANHPDGLYIRLDSGDGDFPAGSSTTMKYKPTARIFSINVVVDRDMNDDKIAFTSEYSDLRKGCKSVGGEEGGHVSTYCPGPGGYRVHYYDTATTMEFSAEIDGDSFMVKLASESFEYPDRNNKIEWRLADGKPFAVIMRTYEYRTDTEFPKQGKLTGQYLVIKGLKGYDTIDERVDASKPKANEQARKTADQALLKQTKNAGTAAK